MPVSSTTSELIRIIPVLPSADISRDVTWYGEKMGFSLHFSDGRYAVLYREAIVLHLQWHADTPDDPLLGGSVVRIQVQNLRPLFEEFVRRGTVGSDKWQAGTPWKTNEFGFYDLNGNAIFFVEDLE